MNGKGDGMGDVICAKAGDERRGKRDGEGDGAREGKRQGKGIGRPRFGKTFQTFECLSIYFCC